MPDDIPTRRHNGLVYWCDAFTWSWSLESCGKDLEINNSMLAKYHQITFHGSYTPILAAHLPQALGHSHCTWVTMFREPISRLVSAYAYCKHSKGFDALCGATVVDARRSSLEKFAAHWGNALFRELLMFNWPVNTSCGVLCQARATKAETVARAMRATFSPVWLIQKVALNGTDNPQQRSDPTLNRVISAVASLELFDVVGVVEQFSLSMKAFDCLVPLARNRSWQREASTHHSSHHSESYANESRRLLHQARTSLAIQRYLQADINIYHRGVLPAYQKLLARQKALCGH